MNRLSISLVGALFALALAACSPDQSDRRPGSPSSSHEQSGLVSTGPLPDNAYSASITVVKPPQTLHAGEQASLDVKVKNLSNVTWPSQGQGSKYKVDLANHWLDNKGEMVTMDDGRAGLPHDLKAGEEAEVLLTVKAPKSPGDYTLELDMVHEDVLWFSSKGSQTVKINVKVQ